MANLISKKNWGSQLEDLLISLTSNTYTSVNIPQIAERRLIHIFFFFFSKSMILISVTFTYTYFTSLTFLYLSNTFVGLRIVIWTGEEENIRSIMRLVVFYAKVRRFLITLYLHIDPLFFVQHCIKLPIMSL